MIEFQRICWCPLPRDRIGARQSIDVRDVRLLKNLKLLCLSRGRYQNHARAGRLCVFCLREGTDWTTAKEAATSSAKVPGVARVVISISFCERPRRVMTEAATSAAMAEAASSRHVEGGGAATTPISAGFDGHEPDHRMALPALLRTPRSPLR